MSRGASRPAQSHGHKMASQLDRKIIHGGRNEVRARERPGEREIEKMKSSGPTNKTTTTDAPRGKGKYFPHSIRLIFVGGGVLPFLFFTPSAIHLRSLPAQRSSSLLSRHSIFSRRRLSSPCRFSSQLIALFIAINSARVAVVITVKDLREKRKGLRKRALMIGKWLVLPFFRLRCYANS